MRVRLLFFDAAIRRRSRASPVEGARSAAAIKELFQLDFCLGQPAMKQIRVAAGRSGQEPP